MLVFLLTFAAVVGFASAQDSEQTDDAARPYLGVYFSSTDNGVRIDRVIADSPADEAGLKAADVITAVGGEEVTEDNFADLLGEYAVGDAVTLSITRGEDTLDIEVTLAAAPEAPNARGRGPRNEFRFEIPTSRPYLGVRMEGTDSGVSIAEVVEDSPAAEAGLQQGDLLKAINGTDVTTPEQAVEIVQGLEAGDEVVLSVERDGETLELTATLAESAAAPQEFFGFPGDGRRFNFSLTPGELSYLAEEKAWEVGELSEDSALAEAGLQEGDKITAITLDGEQIDPENFARGLGRMFMDGTATLTVQRGEETLEIEVDAPVVAALLLGSRLGIEGGGFMLPPFDDLLRPDSGRRFNIPRLPVAPLGARLGVGFVMLDEQGAEQYGVTQTDGAYITQVEDSSPAAAAGLQQGDVVTAVDGEALSLTFSLRDAVAGKQPGDVITLSVARGEETLEIEVALGQPEQFSFLPEVPAA